MWWSLRWQSWWDRCDRRWHCDEVNQGWSNALRGHRSRELHRQLQVDDYGDNDDDDNYLHRNLSYKAILGHHWISSYCPEADLVLKSDDDFFVDLHLLRYPIHPTISSYSSKITISELELPVDDNGFLLACSVWDWGTMPVLRGADGGECLWGFYQLSQEITVNTCESQAQSLLVTSSSIC